ncbi:unnamed protein product [Brassicogethes aeneus]|uniref:Reverse transcriptase domain-containing protein n=1 Tax=Brassicogethes aeneus TaxID=1431903 RepID=A0A9P0B172_BRAAE|nr:unnamed protein product [Brassicogethes aeneus]
MTLFADDTALFYNGNEREIFEDAQRDLIKICDWTSQNNIKLNENKCNYIVFKNTHSSPISLRINNTPISEVKHANYLGLTIDNKLNFEQHIREVKKTINNMCYFLRKNVFLMNQKTKFQIYYAFHT